jgi:hypothetical protein
MCEADYRTLSFRPAATISGRVRKIGTRGAIHRKRLTMYPLGQKESGGWKLNPRLCVVIR